MRCLSAKAVRTGLLPVQSRGTKVREARPDSSQAEGWRTLTARRCKATGQGSFDRTLNQIHSLLIAAKKLQSSKNALSSKNRQIEFAGIASRDPCSSTTVVADVRVAAMVRLPGKGPESIGAYYV
jgi:hypothetical protein